MHWEYTDSGLPTSFRVNGGNGDQNWEVAHTSMGPRTYSASDRSPAVQEGGWISYDLYGREGFEDWQLLATKSLLVEATPLVNALIGVFPNPFNPSTSIKFSLAAAGRTHVAVYDIAGRKLAVLVDGHLEAGPQELIWEGRDQEGHPMSSGVYFCRLEARGFSDARKLVLLQ